MFLELFLMASNKNEESHIINIVVRTFVPYEKEETRKREEGRRTRDGGKERGKRRRKKRGEKERRERNEKQGNYLTVICYLLLSFTAFLK